MIRDRYFSLKHLKKLFATILILVFAFSLKAQEVELIKTDPVNLVELAEIFESVQVIGLEQKYPALFGFRSPIIKVNGNKVYLCLHSQNREMIFGYDLNGKLLHVIDNFGPGPDQLGRVIDFEAVTENQLSIYSQEKGMFFDFDVLEDKIISSHKYTESISITGQFIKVPETDEYYFLKGPTALNMHSPPYYWLTRHNKDLEEVEKFFPERTHSQALFNYMPTLKHNLQLFDHNIRVLKPYGDTIYSVNQSKISPVYALDFGGHKKYNTQTVTPEKVKSIFNQKNGVRGVNFMETKSRLLLAYTFEVGKLTVYDKTNQTAKTAATFKPFDRNGGFRLELEYADDEKAIFSYYTGDSGVDEFLKENFPVDKVENWSTLDFREMEQEEVPFLLIFKFKK